MAPSAAQVAISAALDALAEAIEAELRETTALRGELRTDIAERERVRAQFLELHILLKDERDRRVRIETAEQVATIAVADRVTGALERVTASRWFAAAVAAIVGAVGAYLGLRA